MTKETTLLVYRDGASWCVEAMSSTFPTVGEAYQAAHESVHYPDSSFYGAEIIVQEAEKPHVCVDCVMAIANGDYSGLTDDRVHEVTAGVTKLSPWASIGEEAGFSWRRCECCGDTAGGDRYEVNI